MVAWWHGGTVAWQKEHLFLLASPDRILHNLLSQLPLLILHLPQHVGGEVRGCCQCKQIQNQLLPLHTSFPPVRLTFSHEEGGVHKLYCVYDLDRIPCAHHLLQGPLEGCQAVLTLVHTDHHGAERTLRIGSLRWRHHPVV